MKHGTQIEVTSVGLSVQVCSSCSIMFAVPVSFDTRRRQDGKTFWCPNGHGQHYAESELDRVSRERDQLKQQQAYLDEQRKVASQRAEHERRRANGYKGHAARISKRLARKMASDDPNHHPEAAADAAAA